MRRLVWTLAAIAAAGLSGPSLADDNNQALADQVASQVEKSGKIRGYRLDIETEGGIVTLTGDVANASVREELVDLVRNQPGVLAVRDRIVTRDQSARPAGSVQLINDPAPMSEAAPISEATQGAATQQVIEPEPVMDYQGGIAPFSDAPIVPPYSWPAYTPYNNFASMAYQTQYPSGAWPFIGPPYPYPMIPSGWRRVSLTWKKGYWWMKFNAH